MCEVTACFLGQAEVTMPSLLQDVERGCYRVVYLTPESFSTHQQLLTSVYKHVGIVVVVVEDAHSISQWSFHFQPKSQLLNGLKTQMPQVPVLALSRSPSRPVLQDIVAALGLARPRLLTQPFDSPRITLEVSQRSGSLAHDLQGLVTHSGRCDVTFGGSTLIVCPSPSSAAFVSLAVRSLGVSCELYLESYSGWQKGQIRCRFDHGVTECVVATIRGVMEITKPDIRKVIVIGAPPDMDSLCLALGRAGRDGDSATATVMWGPADISRSRGAISMLKRGPYRQHRLRLLAQLETTLRSRECRRRLLVSHYEEFYPRVSVSTATGNCCDNCDPKHPGKTPTSANVAGPRRDCSRDARLLLLVVIALGGKWGLRATARILRGSVSD
uniref:DNA 3'-5' helicase n=1 Tax=Petromyzon marinus TaxID=7757 RepID=A0AAJ7SL83_PETMA|nr:Werner syndrome ATP-dependent helicase homolog [Petromyzon marinus]